jgi:hypothetical protein
LSTEQQFDTVWLVPHRNVVNVPGSQSVQTDIADRSR